MSKVTGHLYLGVGGTPFMVGLAAGPSWVKNSTQKGFAKKKMDVRATGPLEAFSLAPACHFALKTSPNHPCKRKILLGTSPLKRLCSASEATHPAKPVEKVPELQGNGWARVMAGCVDPSLNRTQLLKRSAGVIMFPLQFLSLS